MDTLKHLNSIRDQLVRTIHTIPDAMFNERPDPKTWSPREVAEHIARMDAHVARLMREGKTEDKKVLKKPIRLTTLRGIKVSAPAQLDPQEDAQSKDAIYQQLFDSRMQVLELYKQFTPTEKKEKAMKHPVFGYLSLRQWFVFLGYHEKRHLKQLDEILRQLKI